MTAPAGPRPVRLALLVDGPAQPAWVVDLLAGLVADGSAVLAGVGELSAGPDAPRGETSRAQAAYLRLDARRYARPDLPTRPADLGPLVAGLPHAALAAAPNDDGRLALDAAGAAAVRAFDADAAWYLGAAPLREPLPAFARWGTWALDPAGGAHGARAMLLSAPATSTALRRLADAGGPAALLGRARTSTQRISVTVNHAEHARHVAELVGAVVRRASRVGPPAPEPAPAPDALDDLPDPPAAHRALGPAEAVRLGARAASRLVRARVRQERTVPRWFVAYHLADHADPDARPDGAAPETDPARFTELACPPDRYWADPFPAEHDGRSYLFYEEHLDGRRDAHLSVAELEPGRGLVAQRVVLERPYHLSFPSVFWWQGAWYMTPETMTERAVQLYRAARFPDGWEYVGDLVTGALFVDPVVACLDGAWWMWVGVTPPGGEEATLLHVYRAPTPLGPWAPHALNPVAVDVRSGRPAGRVFRRGGAYYRPVQDGAPYYGHSMTIHRVDRLTPTEFRETPVARVEPTWRPGLAGTHTLNAAGRLSVLDVLRRVPRAGAGAGSAGARG